MSHFFLIKGVAVRVSAGWCGRVGLRDVQLADVFDGRGDGGADGGQGPLPVRLPVTSGVVWVILPNPA
jgi:hypothetical protein